MTDLRRVEGLSTVVGLGHPALAGAGADALPEAAVCGALDEIVAGAAPARAVLRSERCRQFDPQVVDTFLAILDEEPWERAG